MAEIKRKRALVQLPATIVAQAIGLPPGVHLEFVRQTGDDIVNGQIEFLVSGDGLDPAFLTPGPAVPGRVKFEDSESGPVACIIPLDADSGSG